ncbi:MAG: addiction module protein [Thermoanaerobaculia bacterium]
MKTAEIRKLLELPLDERMELAQILWESVDPGDEARFLAIPDWQRQILEERSADIERNPAAEQTWEEVKAELQPKT